MLIPKYHFCSMVEQARFNRTAYPGERRMNLNPVKRFALIILVGFYFLTSSVIASAGYTIEVTDRHLFGPGPFPDQKLKTATNWEKSRTYVSHYRSTCEPLHERYV